MNSEEEFEMIQAEGIFDGESVKFSAPVNFKKNQRVVVTLAEDSEQKELAAEERKKKFREFTEKIRTTTKPTNYDVDAFIRYERGRATADDIRTLIREGTLAPEDLRDFEKEYFFMEKLLKDAVALEKISALAKSADYVKELRAGA